MMKRQIIFFIPGKTGIGECLIAIYLARQIKMSDENTQIYFFAANCYQSILKEYHINHIVLFKNCGKMNKVLLLDRLYQNDNTYLIISDIINYHTSISDWGMCNEDFSAFQGKIYGVDIYDYENRKFDMDTYGFQASNFKNLERNLPFFDKKIVPCPIGNINSAAGIRYTLLAKEDLVSRNGIEILKCKKELGVPLDKKVILLLSALWQKERTTYANAEKQIQAFDEAYEKIVEYFCTDAVVLCVGGTKKIQDGKNGFTYGINMIGSVPPFEMDKYIKIADVLITRNIISTTVAKAALSGVPAISLICPDKNAQYRYRMYPVGWYEFLDHIVDENPYYEIVQEYNVFEFEEVVNRLKELLYGKVHSERSEKVTKYLEEIWSVGITGIFEEGMCDEVPITINHI